MGDAGRGDEYGDGVVDDFWFSIGEDVRAETEREMSEIKERAVADGTFMKAPNGKPTRLNERQWLQVRTNAFKKWFGDWELAAKVLKVISGVKEHGFNSFEDAKAWAKENIVRTLTNEETGGNGEIRISNNAVSKFLSESAVAKSDNKDVHLSVLRVLPDVIRESVDAEQHPDYKKGEDGNRSAENGINENVTIHRLYGAVDIDGKLYRVKVTLKEDTRNNTLAKKAYSYEATKIELLAGTLGKLKSDAPNTNNSISVAKLLENVESSKEKGKKLIDASKIVDENGEPLVVYHGTTNDETEQKWNERLKIYDTTHKQFTIFRRNTNGERNHGIFFNSDMYNAFAYGYYTYSVYLNTKNPLEIDCNNSSYDAIRYNGEVKDTYEWAEWAEENGYDGVIFRNIRDGVDFNSMNEPTNDYVTFAPNQIKSATDNVGTFGGDDVDIRFSMSPATGVSAGSQVEYSGLQQALKSKDEEVARKAHIARDELNEQMEEDIENYARAKGIWTIARKCVSLQST